MGTPYIPTPAPLPSGGITMPDDGPSEGRDAASVRVPLEALADGIAYLTTCGLIKVVDYRYQNENTAIGSTFTSTSYVDSDAAIVDVEEVEVDDVLLVTAYFQARYVSGGTGVLGRVKLHVVDSFGVSNNEVGTTGSVADINPYSIGVEDKVTLSDWVTVGEAGTTRVTLAGLVDTDGQTALKSYCVLRVVHLRPFVPGSS